MRWSLPFSMVVIIFLLLYSKPSFEILKTTNQPAIDLGLLNMMASISNNKLESIPIPSLHFSLHYMPQLSPFIESLLDKSSSSSSSSGSPPSSCMTSPQAMTTGSSPESPPLLHHAFYLNRLQQMSGSSSSLGPPSCQFLSNSHSPVLYPSQPQFPGPMYPVTNMSSAQGGLWRTFIRYNSEVRHLYIQLQFRSRGMLDYDELCS